MSRSNISFSREKLEDFLAKVGVTVVSDTSTDLLCYCPFHSNRDSPAFNISLRSPHLWKCWSGKCDQKGNLFTLLTKKGYTPKEAEKMLLQGIVSIDEFAEYIQELMKEEDEQYSNDWVGIESDKFQRADKQYSYPAWRYLSGRGISDDGYATFGMGYSHAKRMAVIPIHDENASLIGVVGRTFVGKRYQYSGGFDRQGTVWNVHRAKEYDTLILTEGTLDAVYIWQAGFKNVGAILGSAISDRQWRVIKKYFTDVICFFDNDDAGNGVRDTIINNVRDMGIYVVEYPDRMIKTEGGERQVKDPGELTPEEIQYMLLSKRSSLELMMEAG